MGLSAWTAVRPNVAIPRCSVNERPSHSAGAMFCLCKRMCSVNDIAQAGARDMGVNLGGCDVSMPEHRLNAAEIGPAFNQVRRERVAQHVRGEFGRVEVCFQREGFQHLVQATTCEMSFFAPGWKQVLALFCSFGKKLGTHLEVE